MRVKICGITTKEQGVAIAKLGATSLGFICVAKSPRYVKPERIKSVIEALPHPVSTIGVFANANPQEILKIVSHTGLSGVQLHGDETPTFCQNLKNSLSGVEVIKALRIKDTNSLADAAAYTQYVDTLLLDAYHPQMLGGTGKTLDWLDLQQFNPSIPWLLAGGLTPTNVLDALYLVTPYGIDLSSGVEKTPGDKDLAKVAELFQALRQHANFICG